MPRDSIVTACWPGPRCEGRHSFSRMHGARKANHWCYARLGTCKAVPSASLLTNMDGFIVKMMAHQAQAETSLELVHFGLKDCDPSAINA